MRKVMSFNIFLLLILLKTSGNVRANEEYTKIDFHKNAVGGRELETLWNNHTTPQDSGYCNCYTSSCSCCDNYDNDKSFCLYMDTLEIEKGVRAQLYFQNDIISAAILAGNNIPQMTFDITTKLQNHQALAKVYDMKVNLQAKELAISVKLLILVDNVPKFASNLGTFSKIELPEASDIYKEHDKANVEKIDFSKNAARGKELESIWNNLITPVDPSYCRYPINQGYCCDDTYKPEFKFCVFMSTMEREQAVRFIFKHDTADMFIGILAGNYVPQFSIDVDRVIGNHKIIVKEYDFKLDEQAKELAISLKLLYQVGDVPVHVVNFGTYIVINLPVESDLYREYRLKGSIGLGRQNIKKIDTGSDQSHNDDTNKSPDAAKESPQPVSMNSVKVSEPEPAKESPKPASISQVKAVASPAKEVSKPEKESSKPDRKDEDTKKIQTAGGGDNTIEGRSGGGGEDRKKDPHAGKAKKSAGLNKSSAPKDVNDKKKKPQAGPKPTKEITMIANSDPQYAAQAPGFVDTDCDYEDLSNIINIIIPGINGAYGEYPGMVLSNYPVQSSTKKKPKPSKKKKT